MARTKHTARKYVPDVVWDVRFLDVCSLQPDYEIPDSQVREVIEDDGISILVSGAIVCDF